MYRKSLHLLSTLNWLYWIVRLFLPGRVFGKDILHQVHECRVIMLTAKDRIQDRIKIADPKFQESIQFMGIALLPGEIIGELFLPVFNIKAKPVVKFIPDHFHVYFLEVIEDGMGEGHSPNLQNTK